MCNTICTCKQSVPRSKWLVALEFVPVCAQHTNMASWHCLSRSCVVVDAYCVTLCKSDVSPCLPVLSFGALPVGNVCTWKSESVLCMLCAVCHLTSVCSCKLCHVLWDFRCYLSFSITECKWSLAVCASCASEICHGLRVVLV